MRIVSRILAGKKTWLNDALIAFDAEGNCLGIVQHLNGEPLAEAAGIRPEDEASMRSLPAVFAFEEDAATVDAAEDAQAPAALTNKEIAAILEQRGVDIPRAANKSVLLNLLAESEA